MFIFLSASQPPLQPGEAPPQCHIPGEALAHDIPGVGEAAYGDGAELLGEERRDVYLNGVAYWSNVPARVWDYTIGGYQVLKKWLSYRERKLLGRGLKL